MIPKTQDVCRRIRLHNPPRGWYWPHCKHDATLRRRNDRQQRNCNTSTTFCGCNVGWLWNARIRLIPKWLALSKKKSIKRYHAECVLLNLTIKFQFILTIYLNTIKYLSETPHHHSPFIRNSNILSNCLKHESCKH